MKHIETYVNSKFKNHLTVLITATRSNTGSNSFRDNRVDGTTMSEVLPQDLT